ncbi:heme-binding protein [Streptomyces sp. 4F14]|uniref:GlcG/HbpS family heme-binding protein n=1 Tax=Streptomyces sp. 4F14 TaxID=3394380 RepID=UPI003A8585E3
MSKAEGPHPRDLGLTEARALVRRAVDKAEQVGVSGAIAVVGASGVLITASRMDGGGAGGMKRAWSKAWISAVEQSPSSEHLHHMATVPAALSAGFAQACPQAVFPGAGAMPISVDGVVVAGLAASGARISPYFPADVDPRFVTVDGEPANPEDLVSAYAVDGPYIGHHGDDYPRWKERFGDLVIDRADSLGMTPAPQASQQAQLDWAKTLCDAAIKEASRRGLRVAVAVVDRGGDPIQQDLMDGGSAGGVAVAQAVAGAAALFDCDSESLDSRYGRAETLAPLVIPPVLSVPGGLPVRDGAGVVAGLGIGGGDPAVCAEIARTVLSAS